MLDAGDEGTAILRNVGN